MTTTSPSNLIIVPTPNGGTASVMLFKSGEHVGAIVGYKQGDIDVFDRITGVISEDSAVFSQEVLLACEKYNEKYLHDPEHQFVADYVEEVVGSWFENVSNQYIDHIAKNNQESHIRAVATLVSMRKEMRLSVEDIASRVGVSPDTIRSFEREDDVSLFVLRRYALAVHARMNIHIEKQS